MANKMLEVGYTIPRADAHGKVTGAEKYAADHYAENMLWAGAKRAGVPHGKIKRLDVDSARACPGVLAVLTARDVPGTNRQGIVRKDQPVLAGDRVRHCGDPIALVLAEDRETLQRALALIKVEIEPLPAVFDVQGALRPDAPLVHAGGNVLLHATIEIGAGANALDDCDVVVEDSFETPVQAHAFLETENGLAWQEPGGQLVMIVSSQAPFRDRFEIAHALGLEAAKIRVITPYLGGGFGGKDGATVQCLLALAALNAHGRPVKMQWEREESFVAGYKRHAVRMSYRLGAKADGTLHALDCRVYYDTGAYAHLGGEVMELGMEHAGGPYRLPHTRIEGWCVYTNNPIAGAMRAFGVAQVSFGFEAMIDLLAAKLGLDRLELRLKNAVRRGDKNCAGVTLVHSTGLVPALETLRRHPLWRERESWKRAAPRFKRRGVGLTAVFNAMGYGRGLPDSAIAKVELTAEGNIRIYNAVADMGQGNASTFLQMAGQVLCQDDARLEVVQPDTEQALPSGSSSAGRTTYTYGNALLRACEDLKQKLFHRAALVLMVDDLSGFVLLPGIVRHLPSGKQVSLSVLARLFPAADRVCISHFVMPVSAEVPDTGKEFAVGFPHTLFAYAAHLACIEVDELTGKIEVKHYLAVTDGGQVINPQLFEQQIQGAVAQSIGYALSEQVLLRDGKIQNPNLADYVIPTACDVPDILSIPIETVEPTGPFGMKGIGEVAANGPLPAIAGAVEDALGRRLHRAPLTPDRIVEEDPCESHSL
jgi:CO/xanthine dehydrogenase Mo-binding subunit